MHGGWIPVRSWHDFLQIGESFSGGSVLDVSQLSADGVRRGRSYRPVFYHEEREQIDTRKPEPPCFERRAGTAVQPAV